MSNGLASATLCWDCKRAIGGCRWSEKLKPVKGWVAVSVEKDTGRTYNVIECPLFIRDSYDHGLRKLPRDDISL